MNPASFALGAIAAALGIGVGQAAPAQPDGSALAFDPVPGASVAKPRLQDSVHRRRAQPEHLIPGASNVPIALLDDLGVDSGSTVSLDYMERRPFSFDGKVSSVKAVLNK